MSEVLSPKDYKKKLSKKKSAISKHNINFENFKIERKKKLNYFFIACGIIWVLSNLVPTAGVIIGFIIPAILIFGSPAIVQYSRGDLNWTNWIWYCLGMCVIGIGFIFLFFFLPPQDRLEKEFKEFKLKKIKK